MKVRGVVENTEGLIRPLSPLNLEVGTEVEIVVRKRKPATAQELVRALEASGFIGLWEHRTDIGDSSEFARTLRERAQKRRRD